MSRTTIGASLAAVVALATAVLVLVVPASAASGQVGVGFNAPAISGFQPGGKVFLSGGGAYDPRAHPIPIPRMHPYTRTAASAVSKTSDRAPSRAACKGRASAGDSEGLLASTGFKCTGAASEAGKTAVTNEHTAVLLSDFYRAGDGNDASFKNVKVIVADHDLAPDIDGIQNVWIQQVSCGTARINFSS